MICGLYYYQFINVLQSLLPNFEKFSTIDKPHIMPRISLNKSLVIFIMFAKPKFTFNEPSGRGKQYKMFRWSAFSNRIWIIRTVLFHNNNNKIILTLVLTPYFTASTHLIEYLKDYLLCLFFRHFVECVDIFCIYFNPSIL